jgi:hypothetical protein
MRRVIGFLGILLVPVLILGSLILDHTNWIKVSVSAYYYSHMRNVLVGVLCGISLFLFSYHGYTWKDSFFSKLAGFFAVCAAFFPTSSTNDKDDLNSILHYVTAGIFFVILSYMSIVLFTRTSGNETVQKKKRNQIYRICGILMLVSVAFIPLDLISSVHDKIAFIKPTLILETIALFAFGFSWLTKGEFLLKDK